MGSVFKLKPYQPKARYIPKVTKHEESVQRRVCSYLRRHYPDLIFRSDYASGLRLTINQARVHRSLQSGRAWPDLFIYAPSRGYAGLALEIKKEGTAIVLRRGPNKGHLVADQHIREQAALLKQLKALGYYANFACGYDDAVKIIEWYFDRPQTAQMF